MSYEIPHVALRMVRESTITVAVRECSTAHDAAKIAHALIGDRPVEHMIAILLDGRNNVTGVTTLAQGGASHCAISVPDVLRAVLVGKASGFILAHNHPSGDSTPSREDIAATRKIAEAAKIVGCPMLDHVIVTSDPSEYSFVDT